VEAQEDWTGPLDNLQPDDLAELPGGSTAEAEESFRDKDPYAWEQCEAAGVHLECLCACTRRALPLEKFPPVTRFLLVASLGNRLMGRVQVASLHQSVTATGRSRRAKPPVGRQGVNMNTAQSEESFVGNDGAPVARHPFCMETTGPPATVRR
jgi:hypothetical protein